MEKSICLPVLASRGVVICADVGPLPGQDMVVRYGLRGCVTIGATPSGDCSLCQSRHFRM